MKVLALLLVARVLTPCISDGGRLFLVKGDVCPAGSMAAIDALPDACESGFCEACPPGGCPPLESNVLCCCGSGPGACVEIIATTNECDPECDLAYCENGYCDETGEAHCIIE
jgi:hypothetical protein